MKKRKHSPDVRAAILAEVEAGPESIVAIAKKHHLHKSTIYQWRHADKKAGKKSHHPDLPPGADFMISGHRVVKLSKISGEQNGTGNDRERIERATERHVIFAFGHCQGWLEVYANSLSIPPAHIAERVGQLLLLEARGKKLRIDNRMSGLW